MNFMQNGRQVKTGQIWKADIILAAVGSVLTLIVIVLALLQIGGIFEDAVNIYEPLMGVVMILQGIRSWKRNKLIAIASFAAAIFIFAVAAVVLFPFR